MKSILLLPPTYYFLFAPGADGFCTDRRSWPVGISSERGRARGLVRHPTCTHARPKVTDEEYDERKEKLRQLLCLDQKSVDKLVDGHPPVLKLNIDENIAPKSEMLQRKLGIDQKGAGEILRIQGLSLQKQETLVAKIDYLQNRMGLSQKQLAKLLVACSALLTRSIKKHYDPLFSSLQISFGFTQDDIAKLAMRSPQLLWRASEKGTEPVARFLPQVLGLDVQDKEGLKKYIWRDPPLLYASEPQLNKSYEWLLNLLGGNKSVVERVFRNNPQLLGFTIETLQNKVDWYQKKLSLTDEEIRKVVAQSPTILSLGIEDGKMDNKISHIQQIFELNNEEFKELFLSRPEIVALSAEKNIGPKLELYGSLIGKERARKLVVESSNLLLPSMEELIQPRLDEVDKSYEYVKWTETLLRRLVRRQPKAWCAYMLDDAPRGPGEKLDDSGKYKRRWK